MTQPRIVSYDEWWSARMAFLEKEKELTRARDALSAERRALPMRLVEKDYVFTHSGGKATLLDLFDGRGQLIVYHFMGNVEGHGWCPICSYWVDNIGHLAHFHARDTSLAVVCPEPVAEMEAFRARMGWTMPWYSCLGNGFYEDFHIPLTEGGEPEAPGVSAFLRDGDRILYAYSTHRRGSDVLNGTYNYLDLTPLGRQEEDPEDPMGWLRHHDAYGQEESRSCG
ncbi:DUF899 domain-containing protein [Actinoallomurus sp. NPDC050550]|uniref:DUF899 domain-containing protein n=1 Tax=Actinoallomurus sp. NPDC050550 TaxID=3154937 RepID=UPI00340670FD